MRVRRTLGYSFPNTSTRHVVFRSPDRNTPLTEGLQNPARRDGETFGRIGCAVRRPAHNKVPPGRAEITLTVTPPEDDEGPTLGDLRDSEFFGMWANRTDITDSVDFARQLRRRAWDRQS